MNQILALWDHEGEGERAVDRVIQVADDVCEEGDRECAREAHAHLEKGGKTKEEVADVSAGMTQVIQRSWS